MIPFRLSRFLSIASLVGLVIAMLALALLYRHSAHEILLEHEDRSNVALAAMLMNDIWPAHGAFIGRTPSLARATLADRPEVAALRTDVARELKGLPVLKVKIYHPSGLVVFSTETAQIGRDESGNAHFRQALAGTPARALIFRDRLIAVEGTVADRSLVSSYMPVRSRDGGPVEAVLEFYSDITPLLARFEVAQWRLSIGTIAAFLTLYVFLLLVVRRADRLLKAQEAERHAAQASIRHRAYHDALTELPNRARFSEQLDSAIKRARRSRQPLALMFLDVDHFKTINDRFGHQGGDELLCQIAERLRLCVRESDMVFRVGGDEFTILLENLQHIEDPAALARRIQNALQRPLVLGGEAVAATFSIGIAVSSRDDAGLDTLVQDADTAMYRAKQAGRNLCVFYSPDLKPAGEHRLTTGPGPGS